ncbi:hypothetical protein ABI_21410 [Asticcacaulis biprosthecium C19]|uniref:Uncharacterized protein n=1 Tax=Asticcacaulis biprosthecium C19 TaxID=715226 RepID=F4QGL8_9CAUL|nr:hypothetical protein ABI_21410 [Asticcacaulis biprosthecium C19]
MARRNPKYAAANATQRVNFRRVAIARGDNFARPSDRAWHHYGYSDLRYSIGSCAATAPRCQ